MDRAQWRSLRPWYLFFILAFPLVMGFVESRPLHGPTICLFRQFTHLDCPSCGLTRSFRAMGRLDVVNAIRYNPLGPALFATTVLYWGYVIAVVATGGRVSLPPWWLRWRYRLLWYGIILFVLVGMARMIYEIGHPPPPPQPWHLQWYWPA